MDDYPDRSHHPSPYAMAADLAQQAGRQKNKVPLETRPEFGVEVVEESSAGIVKDITVIHTDWKSGKKGPGVELYVPGPKREAVAWQVAHTYFAYDGAEMFVCNICGKDLKLSGTAGAISSHLKRKHPGVKEKMEEVERRNAKKKRKRSDLPLMAGGKMIKLENPKMVPYPRDTAAMPAYSTEKMPALPFSSRKGNNGSKTVERKMTAVQAQKKAQIMHLICEGLPCSHVESPLYKQLLETTAVAARTGVGIPQMEMSAQNVRARVIVASKKLREHLKQRIKGKELCGATNHWTSRQNITYVSFSVQWIENFQLESAVLAVYIIKMKPGEEIKESLLQKMATEFEQWDIGSSLKFVVSDRSIDSNAFGEAVRKMPDLDHIDCLGQMLDQVAKKAFEGALGIPSGGDFGAFDEVSESSDFDLDDGVSMPRLLPKVRKLVKHFESSIQASDELAGIAREAMVDSDRSFVEPLAQDISAVWWSTSHLLERLFGLRESITTYSAQKWVSEAVSTEKRPPRLLEEEWTALKEVQFLLKPLRFAQQMLRDQESITASFVPLVVHLISKDLENIYNDDSNSANVKAASKEMLGAMEEQFGNFSSRLNPSSALGAEVKIHKAILMAHALDPRFKPLSVFPTDVQEKIWSDLLDEMVQLGSVMAPPDSTSDTLVKEEDVEGKEKEQVAGSGVSSELDSLFQLYSTKQKDTVRRKPKDYFDAENWKRKCEIELKQYQETTGMEPQMDSDVLRQWWGEGARSSVFPILWRLAQRFLCINATSSPAQRAFNPMSNQSIMNRCTKGAGVDECLLFENYNLLDEAGVWEFSE